MSMLPRLLALHFLFLSLPTLVLADGNVPGAQTLRDAAGKRILIGTAVSKSDLDKPTFGRLVAEQFECLTAGNEMKPDFLQREKGKFTFDRADGIVRFAEANKQQVIGHTLCWHQQTPRWMYEDEQRRPLSREAALANLKNHIDTVVKHFKGKIKGWDVVNEAISDGSGYLRDTPARRAIGDDFVLKAFQFAHEADPDVELYYNDYSIEQDNKRARAIRLIREIKAAGLRIDGVGVQGHWLLKSPDLAELERGLRELSKEGVNLMITELDVDPLPRGRGGAGADLNATENSGVDPYKTGLPPEVQQELAERYGKIFSLILEFPQVKRVTFWGVGDGDSWLNNFPVRGRTNHPLLWDRSLQPKPAFDAVMKTLRGATPG